MFTQSFHITVGHADIFYSFIYWILYVISATLGLSDDQKQIQKVATDYAKNELFPNMAKWDEEVNISNFLLVPIRNIQLN